MMMMAIDLSLSLSLILGLTDEEYGHAAEVGPCLSASEVMLGRQQENPGAGTR